MFGRIYHHVFSQTVLSSTFRSTLLASFTSWPIMEKFEHRESRRVGFCSAVVCVALSERDGRQF